MSAMGSSSEILFDGLCKVLHSSPVDQPKRGIFNRNRENLSWKQRYCLISQDGTDINSVAVLTVYKAKKILRTNDTHTTKVCYRILLDTHLTVLTEDRLTDFVFHLDKDNITISFACETKFIRNSWVSTITQSQKRSEHTTPPQHHMTTTPSSNEKDDEKDDRLEVSIIPEALNTSPPRPLSVIARSGSVGGGAETTRFQLQREQSLPTYSGGLELDLHDDKPPSKSISGLSKRSNDNNSANELEINKLHTTKGSVVAESIETGDVSMIPDKMTAPDDTKSNITFGHPSAKLPPKPPLLIPIVRQQSTSPNASTIVGLTRGRSSAGGDEGVGLTGKDNGSLLLEQGNPSGPMWMAGNKDESPKKFVKDSNFADAHVNRGATTQLGGKRSDDLFFDSKTVRERQFGIPYSVFDFNSLNMSQDFVDTPGVHAQLGAREETTETMTVAYHEGRPPLVNDNTCNENEVVSLSLPESVSQAGGMDVSLMSEVDQDVILPLLMGPEQDSVAKLQLQREVKSLMKLNNELHVKMEHNAVEASRSKEQAHKLALSMQSEITELNASCDSLTAQNNHLTEQMKAMTLDMKELDMQCQEKERMCLKNESDLNSLDSYRKLTEQLTRDNTDLLCELDKIQVCIQRGVSNEDSSSKEKKILLDQLQNSDTMHKKNINKLHEAEAANVRLKGLNEHYKKDLTEMASAVRVCELELKTLRSRFDSEVLDEVSQETMKFRTLEAENSEYRRKENEYEGYKSDNTRLKQELLEQSELVQRLSADSNVDSVQKLTKVLTDMTVERDECKRWLSDKQDSLLAMESKLVDEQKKVFQLTMVVAELKDDVKHSEGIREAATADYNKKMDTLSAKNSKIACDVNKLTERCETFQIQLRDVEEELRNEYEQRLKERKEFNATRLDLEDSLNREMILSKKGQCRIEELEGEYEYLKNKVTEHGAVSVAFDLKRKEMEKSLDDTSSLLVNEQRKNKTLLVECESLQDVIEKLKASRAASLQASQSNVEELQQALNMKSTKVQETLQQMKEKKKDFKTNTLELNASLQEANSRCDALSDEIARIQSARKRAKEEDIRELADAHEQVKRLNAQLDTVKGDLNMKLLEIESHIEKNSVLQLVADNKKNLDKKLVDVQLKFKQSEMDVTTLKDKLTFSENAVKENHACIEKHEVTITNLEEICRNLKTNTSDLKHHQEQEEKVKHKIEVEYELLKKHNEEVCHALGEIEAKLKTKISKYDESSTELSHLRIELETTHDENANLLATVKSLRESSTTGEATLREMFQEKNALHDEILTLTKKTHVMESLESKIQFDAEKLSVLQGECDLLYIKVEDMETLKIETDERIAILEADIAVVPELENKLAILSGVEVEGEVIKIKMKELERENHDHEKVVSEFAAKEQSYQHQLAELQNQLNSTSKLCDKKIRATETALDTQTSDRNSAFQVIKAAVQCLLGKESHAVEDSEDSLEDFGQWYDRLCTVGDGKDVIRCDSATLASYGCLLRAAVAQLSNQSTRCTQCLSRYIENQHLLKEYNSQNLEDIEDVKNCISKNGKQSLLLRIENIISKNFDVNTNANADEILLGSDVHAGLYHSIYKMIECFEDFVSSIKLRNTLIEILANDNVRLSEERDAMGKEVQRVQTTAYMGELDASRYRREKLELESILRSRMSTQDFFEIVSRLSSSCNTTDLDQYSSPSHSEEKSEEKELERRYPCPDSLSPPQEFDFFSSTSLTASGFDEDEDNGRNFYKQLQLQQQDQYADCNQQRKDHDDEDCASSISLCTKEYDYSPPPEFTNNSPPLLKTGRAARVSILHNRGGGGGHLADESKIADMFSADVEFEF